MTFFGIYIYIFCNLLRFPGTLINFLLQHCFLIANHKNAQKRTKMMVGISPPWRKKKSFQT